MQFILNNSEPKKKMAKLEEDHKLLKEQKAISEDLRTHLESTNEIQKNEIDELKTQNLSQQGRLEVLLEEFQELRAKQATDNILQSLKGSRSGNHLKVDDRDSLYDVSESVTVGSQKGDFISDKKMKKRPSPEKAEGAQQQKAAKRRPGAQKKSDRKIETKETPIGSQRTTKTFQPKKIESDDESCSDDEQDKSTLPIKEQVERDMKHLEAQGKNELELINKQHENILKKQEGFTHFLANNAGDLLASKQICDQLMELKKYIEKVFQQNLDHLKRFEDDEEILINDFALDQAKLHLFLEIMEKMFMYEQKIKAFKDLLKQFGKDGIEFGEYKATMLEAFEEKVTDLQDKMVREEQEIKQKQKNQEDMKKMSKEIETKVKNIVKTLKSDTKNQDNKIEIKTQPGGQADTVGKLLNLDALTALIAKKDELSPAKSPKKNITPGKALLGGLTKQQPAAQLLKSNTENQKKLEDLKTTKVITTQTAEETLIELNKSCPETEKLIRWVVSIEQLNMPQRQRFLDLLKYLQEIPIWQKDTLIDYGCVWNYSIEYMAMSSDSSRLFFGTNDGHLLQWNCREKKITKDYGNMHSHRIDGLTVTPDNQFIYTTSLDGSLKLIDIYSKEIEQDFGIVWEAGFENMAAGPKGEWIYIITKDNHMLVWNVMSRKLEKDHGIIYEGKDLRCIRVTKDNKWAFIGTDDGHLLQWNIQQSKLQKDHGAKHTEMVRCMCITNDSKWLFTGGEDTKVLMWNVEKGKLEHDFGTIHKKPIRCIAVDNEGGKVYTGSEDRTIKVWSVQNKTLFHDMGQVYGKWVKQLYLDYTDQFQFGLSVDARLKQWYIADLEDNVTDTLE